MNRDGRTEFDSESVSSRGGAVSFYVTEERGVQPDRIIELKRYTQRSEKVEKRDARKGKGEGGWGEHNKL